MSAMDRHGPASGQESPASQNRSFDDGEEDGRSKTEERSSSSSEAEQIGPQTEITWQYLTFETKPPAPSFVSESMPIADRTTRPECPNLDRYMSPFLWAKRRKNFMMWMSCIATAMSAYTAGSYALGVDRYMNEWHVSEPAAEVGISVFTFGFGVAPMFLAPFSEIQGRRPVFLVTGVLFVCFQLTCALTPTFAGMIVARFLVGCAGSTFSTMVGGVVSDMYHAADRNTAMALFAGSALFGTGIGPLVSGFIAQNLSWRWIFYLQTITNAAVVLVIVFFFKETRGSVLLSRKAKTLNVWYEELEACGRYGVLMPQSEDSHEEKRPVTQQRIRWKVESDEERSSIGKMIGISLYRPFHLLVTEPVVFFFSLWISFGWSILYLTLVAVPLVYRKNHNFDLAQIGAIFTVVSIAAIFSTAIAVYQEPLARRYFPSRYQDFLRSPEGRLSFSCLQSALLPIGCFWFAWSLSSSTPWIVPTLGLGCATMGIFSIYLAVFNYLADIYHRYASSALAAQSFCRNMLAGAFPIFTAQMFARMTYSGAGSFLGAFSALLTVVPWILVFYGPRIRAKSKIARELLVDKDSH